MIKTLPVARALVVAVAAMGLITVTTDPAWAQTPQPRVVSENPSNSTPHLAANAVRPDPAVYALAQLGNTMYAGGQFNAIQNPARTATYIRPNLVSFDATTGAVSRAFAPKFNSHVWALQASGDSLYVGGQFTTVNGVSRRGLAKINATTGALDTRFRPVVVSSGFVKEVRLVNNRLIIAGSFPRKLAALNPITGADTGYVNLAIGGSYIYRFAVNPAGTRLVALGTVTTVNGLARRRAFMLDLGPLSAALDPWYYQPLAKSCRSASTVNYMRDVDFSPDGTYFVFVSTGYVPNVGDLGMTLCDAAARFETNIPNPTRPTWINYTGGDTLHSVAVTGAAVYVNGHQRWLDNPGGRDFCAPGCVSRPGIGAIDPTTGKALPWNPTKTRGVGGKDMLATNSGLWVASDGKYFHGEYHWGIAFLPL